MWTHKHCYSKGIQTSEEINKIARLELAQSLKFGRTIAIVGSGVSAAYGHLTWDELGKFMVLDTLDRASRYLKQNKGINDLKANQSKIKRIIRELIDIAQVDIVKIDEDYIEQHEYYRLINFKFDADTVILQLCRYANELIKEPEQVQHVANELDTIVRKIFSGSYYQRFRARLRCICYKSYRILDDIVINHQSKEKFDQIFIPNNNTQITLDESQQESITILLGIINKLQSKPSKDDIDKLVNFLKSKIKQYIKVKSTQYTHIKLDTDLFTELNNVYKSTSPRLAYFAIWTFINLYFYDRMIEKNKLNGHFDTILKSPYSILINQMKLSRFVTLNYDEEIEATFKKFAFEEKTLFAENDSVSGYTDGYGGVLVSKAPTIDSVGDLLVFSSTSSDCTATVLHLHGATTIAKNSPLLLSEDDYQNQYLKGLERRIVFDEGLRTLFGGNDILFLGVGMSEEDLLRPLRQYLAERPKFPRQARTLVALKEYSYKESTGSKESPVSHTNSNCPESVKDEYNEFEKSKKHIASICKANRETLSMKFKYDVRIIGYHIELKDKIPIADEVINTSAYESDMSQYYINKTHQKEKRLEEQCLYLEKINDETRQWWEAWQRRPKYRLAKWTTKNKITSRYTLLTFDDTELSEQYFIALRDKIGVMEVPESKRRILRFSAPRGDGKGYFITMLRTDPQHGKLFGVEDYLASFFADAYFSTEFNSVISSFGVFLLNTIGVAIEQTIDKNLIIDDALNNYISDGDPYNQDLFQLAFPKQIDSNTIIGKLNIIRILLVKLNYYLKILSSRILICISGLDRICNSRGYGYNALHRSFFKLLAWKKELECINYDLIIVAGEPNAPLHYLSLCKPNPNNKPYNRESNQNLLAWTRLPDPRMGAAKIECLSHINDKSEIMVCKQIITRYRKESVFFNFIMTHIIKKIKIFDRENAQKLSDDLCHKISDILSSEKPPIHQSIGIFIDSLGEIDKDNFPGLRKIQSVLKHLALFSYPVEVSVIKVCPDIENTFHNYNESKDLEDTLQWLYDNCLVLRFSQTVKDSGIRYALHRMVRDFLAERMDYAIYDRDEHSFFDVSVYAEQPRDLPSPKYKDYRAIQKILNTLNKITTNALRYVDSDKITLLRHVNPMLKENIPDFLEKYVTSKSELSDEPQKLIDLINMLRASIHLMNTAFSVGVISRMNDFEFVDLYETNSQKPTPLERYCDTASSILCNAVRVDTALEFFSDKTVWYEYSNFDSRMLRVFYPTQIAWLYNEQAVTRFVQGRLYECIPLYDLAIKTLKENNWSANWDSENKQDYQYPENSSLRRVLLNKAIALIEFGKIDAAKKILKNLNQRGEIHQNNNSLTVILSGAYLGLCCHLRGNYDEARLKYNYALKKLKLRLSCERSKALIYKYLGDLDRTEKKYDDSRLSLELAANFAESVHQRDVYYQIMLSIAKLNLKEKKYTEAFNILKDSELYARKLGIPKLLVDCWMVRGHINLLQNQTTIAGEYLSNAIATSSRNGMVLFKVASLHMYCAMLDTRNTDEARRYAHCIRHAAKTRSERMGYPFKVEFNVSVREIRG